MEDLISSIALQANLADADFSILDINFGAMMGDVEKQDILQGARAMMADLDKQNQDLIRYIESTALRVRINLDEVKDPVVENIPVEAKQAYQKYIDAQLALVSKVHNFRIFDSITYLMFFLY